MVHHRLHLDQPLILLVVFPTRQSIVSALLLLGVVVYQLMLGLVAQVTVPNLEPTM